MHIIETGDAHLYSKVWGEGPPVVLIHGWPLSADSWDPISHALAEAGFIDFETSLRPDPIPLEPAYLLDYLRTVLLGRHLDRLPPHEHDGYVRAVADAMPEPVIDYVRLELSARRA